MSKKKFLIFSGHNDRAVFALCRFFESRNLPFVIIAANEKDKILESRWSKNVLFIRSTKLVNFELFSLIRKYTEDNFFYCPTTEFINNFFLRNEMYLQKEKFYSPLPHSDVYYQLSNKKSSINIIDELCEILLPKEIMWDERVVPCVFKPKENIISSEVNYPQLCFNEKDLDRAYLNLDRDDWFVQEYVTGQSYYLCAYISQTGNYRSFWQVNLIQQAGGKSIVLAKSSKNPGIDDHHFIKRLIDIKYHGPMMMEVLKKANGEIYFIEINPRFWGPLQLTFDFQPELLDLFSLDAGYAINSSSHANLNNQKEVWYAWADGAKNPNCKYFPESEKLTSKEIDILLSDNDVYNVIRDQVK